MLAKVLVLQAQFVLHLIMSPAGYTNTTRFCQRFNPRRYVDTVAVNAAVFFNDIPEVHTNTKLHLAVIRQLLIPFRQLTLDFHRTIDGIYNTGKFGQYIVPWGIK